MFSLLHTFQPEPVAIAIGSFAIHWYGIFAAIGMVAAWIVIERLAKQYAITKDLFPVFIGSVFFGITGARIYHVLNEWAYYAEHVASIPRIWEGGLALHGGMLGIALFMGLWCWKKSFSFWKLADIVVTGGILIQIFGRFGNYFNQELFGRPTALPWGIPIAPMYRPEQYAEVTYFHPTFLYEALLTTLLFLCLVGLHRRILRGTLLLKDGTIFLTYLFLYSCIRVLLETVRIDMTPIIAGIRLPLVVSLVLALLSLTLIIRNLYEQKISR